MRLFTLTVLALSGCTSIVPSTALQLSAMSPMEADPAGFAVAMTLPEGLDIEQGSAELAFNATRTDTGEKRHETFVLERLSANPITYRVAPNDLDALRAFQVSVRQWKAENGDATSGSLSVTLSPCKIGDGPADDARASLSIRTTSDGPFMLLIRNGPVSAIAKPEQIREMGECSTSLRQ